MPRIPQERPPSVRRSGPLGPLHNPEPPRSVGDPGPPRSVGDPEPGSEHLDRAGNRRRLAVMGGIGIGVGLIISLALVIIGLFTGPGPAPPGWQDSDRQQQPEDTPTAGQRVGTPTSIPDPTESTTSTPQAGVTTGPSALGPRPSSVRPRQGEDRRKTIAPPRATKSPRKPA